MKSRLFNRRVLNTLSKLSYMLGAACVIAALLVNAVPAAGVSAEATYKKGDNPGQCFGDADVIKDEQGSDGWEIHAPEGYVFEDAMVKASTECYSDGDLYSIQGIGTSTVTAIRICQEGPDCHEISHLEGTYKPVQPPPPPDLFIEGYCAEEGGAMFKVSNLGGDMQEAVNWSVSTVASGTLKLDSLMYDLFGPYGYDETVTFTVDFDGGISAESYCKSDDEPEPPVLNVAGMCGDDGAEFIVTNIGTDMEEVVPWYTSTGDSGTLQLANSESQIFGPYGYGETVTFTVDFKGGISADSYCESVPEPPVLTVSGACKEDGKVLIIIENISDVDMTEDASWQLFVDSKLEDNGDVLLMSGGSKQLEFNYPNEEVEFVLQAPNGAIQENLKCEYTPPEPPKPKFDDCYHPLLHYFTLYVENKGADGYIGYDVLGEFSLIDLGIFTAGETKSFNVSLLNNNPDNLQGLVSFEGVIWEKSGGSHVLDPKTAKVCPYHKLVLEGYCTDDYPEKVFWTVTNENDYAVTYVWKWNALGSEVHLRDVFANAKDEFSTDYFNGHMEIWSLEGDILFDMVKAPLCKASDTPPENPPETVVEVVPAQAPIVLAPVPVVSEASALVPVTGVADTRPYRQQMFFALGLGFIGLGMVLQGLGSRKENDIE